MHLAAQTQKFADLQIKQKRTAASVSDKIWSKILAIFFKHFLIRVTEDKEAFSFLIYNTEFVELFWLYCLILHECWFSLHICAVPCMCAHTHVRAHTHIHKNKIVIKIGIKL